MALVAVATADLALLATTQLALTEGGFTSIAATPDLDLMRVVFEARPEGVIVHLDLAERASLELLRVLRAASDVPVVVLAAAPEPETTARALEFGADDVARADTPAVELIARLNASMRRQGGTIPYEDQPSVVRTGEIEIDRTAREVRKRGEAITLARTEYRLLDAMAARVDRTVPHRFLLSTVWGEEHAGDTHYLRVYVGYLRHKLEDDPNRPRYILNERGQGYRLALLPEGPPGEDAPGAESGEDAEPVVENRVVLEPMALENVEAGSGEPRINGGPEDSESP